MAKSNWDKQLRDILKVLPPGTNIPQKALEKSINSLRNGAEPFEVLSNMIRDGSTREVGMKKEDVDKYISIQKINYKMGSDTQDFVVKNLTKAQQKMIKDTDSFNRVLRVRAIELQKMIRNNQKKIMRQVPNSIFSGNRFVAESVIATMSQGDLMRLIERLQDAKTTTLNDMLESMVVNPEFGSPHTDEELEEFYNENIAPLAKKTSLTFEKWIDWNGRNTIHDFNQEYKKDYNVVENAFKKFAKSQGKTPSQLSDRERSYIKKLTNPFSTNRKPLTIEQINAIVSSTTEFNNSKGKAGSNRTKDGKGKFQKGAVRVITAKRNSSRALQARLVKPSKKKTYKPGIKLMQTNNIEYNKERDKPNVFKGGRNYGYKRHKKRTSRWK